RNSGQCLAGRGNHLAGKKRCPLGGAARSGEGGISGGHGNNRECRSDGETGFHRGDLSGGRTGHCEGDDTPAPGRIKTSAGVFQAKRTACTAAKCAESGTSGSRTSSPGLTRRPRLRGTAVPCLSGWPGTSPAMTLLVSVNALLAFERLDKLAHRE